jgi:rhodanese-related sulfurtransferase
MDSSQTPYFTAPLSPMLNTEFFQAVQARNTGTPPFITRSLRDTPMNLHMGPKMHSSRRDDVLNKPVANGHFTSPDHLHTILSSNKLLLLDARSFVQFSHSHIRNAVGVSVPTTILKRPTFTLEKLSEAIVNDESKKKLQNWQHAEYIILYDQTSHSLQDASASAIQHLYTKFQKQGYNGHLSCLAGEHLSYEIP